MTARAQSTPRKQLGNGPWRERGGRSALVAAALLALAPSVWANGGPFIVKYPGGDPAAKGILARLDPTLMPARESRLKVLSEELTVRFEPGPFGWRSAKSGREQVLPLVAVTARYHITNATSTAVEMDFGFPILRGVYLDPMAMIPMPDAQVLVDESHHLRPQLISNSAIYGLLRQRAEKTITHALSADRRLGQLGDELRSASPAVQPVPRQKLHDYLQGEKGWRASDAALLVQYVCLRPGKEETRPVTGGAQARVISPIWGGDPGLQSAAGQSAWAVKVIGEQKATQWLARLAACLDPGSANGYEELFQAWGGDVRERSVDVLTREVRPREISLRDPQSALSRHLTVGDHNPTVYARVDYLESKGLSPEQTQAWQMVLQHLPVIFTFAPMNLLHYRVEFEPGALRTVTVTYRQYAYLDSRPPASYQVAYVLHPASLWDQFGPIHLTVQSPAGVKPLLPTPLRLATDPNAAAAVSLPGEARLLLDSRRGMVGERTGELFVAIKAADWEKAMEALAGVSEPSQTSKAH